MKSVISAKGQVTVPVEVREKLGLRAGTAIRFEIVKGAALLRKGGRGPHPVDRVYGTLRLRRPVDRILDEMRGPRPGTRRRRR